ncbi:hypothetical protein J6590_003505 [Homalodisca vitripennis]|nr:hypothetical protein J6590_003505 [Homalodisca vitripennis]
MALKLELLVFIALSIQAHLVQSQSKCDRSIIENIHAYWSRCGPPCDILSTLSSCDKIYEIGTTSCFYPEEVKCVSYTIIDSYASVTVTYEDRDDEHFTEILQETEPGILYEQETGSKVYVIFFTEGIFATYICSDTAPEGKPVGIISAIHGNEINQEYVHIAEGILELVDERLSIEDWKSCDC